MSVLLAAFVGLSILSPVQAQTNAPVAPADASAEPTKPCFKCDGTGRIKCPVCKDGQVDCPGPCLKLSKGDWQHQDVAGHDPSLLWQRFKWSNGYQYTAWSQSHVGEVIEMQSGVPVNVGKCKICGGTGRVACKTCGGTGTVVCDVCGGKKVVPQSWTVLNYLKLKSGSGKPTGSSDTNVSNAIQLKGGRVVHGRITKSNSSSFSIKTDAGETNEVDKNDVLDIGPGAL